MLRTTYTQSRVSAVKKRRIRLATRRKFVSQTCLFRVCNKVTVSTDVSPISKLKIETASDMTQKNPRPSVRQVMTRMLHGSTF